MLELNEGEVPLLSTGDGLGEKLPVTKSQMLPVTPFTPTKERQKKIILHTLLQTLSDVEQKRRATRKNYRLLSARLLTLFRYLQKCDSLQSVQIV